jgi:hypothetical protein
MSYPCKNFELCECVLDTIDNKLCLGCQIVFGTSPYSGRCRGKGALVFKDNVECPVCLEDGKRGVSQPRCEHFACVDCFKRCYYGDTEGEPPFPYPEIKDEYMNSDEDEDARWKIEYPLIITWSFAYTKWNDMQNKKFEREKHLRVCPLCRA